MKTKLNTDDRTKLTILATLLKEKIVKQTNEELICFHRKFSFYRSNGVEYISKIEDAKY